VTDDDQDYHDVSVDLLGITGAFHISSPVRQEFEVISHTIQGIAFNILHEIPDTPWEPVDIRSDDQRPHNGAMLLLLDNDDNSIATLRDHLTKFDNAHDRINRWLLHQLHISPREVCSLRREVLACSPELQEWAMLVLSEWYKDEAGHGQSYFQGSIERSNEAIEDILA
jgi:hypothetical protein